MHTLLKQTATDLYRSDELLDFAAFFDGEAAKLRGANDARQQNLQQVYRYLATYLRETASSRASAKSFTQAA